VWVDRNRAGRRVGPWKPIPVRRKPQGPDRLSEYPHRGAATTKRNMGTSRRMSYDLACLRYLYVSVTNMMPDMMLRTVIVLDMMPVVNAVVAMTSFSGGYEKQASEYDAGDAQHNVSSMNGVDWPCTGRAR
jgi:hypothetical protein